MLLMAISSKKILVLGWAPPAGCLTFTTLAPQTSAPQLLAHIQLSSSSNNQVWMVCCWCKLLHRFGVTLHHWRTFRLQMKSGNLHQDERVGDVCRGRFHLFSLRILLDVHFGEWWGIDVTGLLADFDPPCGLDFWCRWRSMPSPSMVVPVGLALSWWLRQCVWAPSNAPDLVNGCDNKLNMSHAAQQLVKLCAPYLLLHWRWLWYCVCSMFEHPHMFKCSYTSC